MRRVVLVDLFVEATARRRCRHEASTEDAMSTKKRSRLTDRAAWRLGVVCLAVLYAATLAVEAQEEVVAEPSAYDTMFEQSSEGNVAQAALMTFNQGVRELDRAEKLAERATTEEVEKKRIKLLERSAEANEAAVAYLMQALKTKPDMIEAYDALGMAFRRLGKYQEALEIHAIALRRDPDSLDNFAGWAESLLELNMLGNATASYTKYAEEGSPRAPILMDAMKKWLASRQADPGDLDPEHIQRMADWLAQQEQVG
jgi:tetratricopeptide (TPR) repeat protein